MEIIQKSGFLIGALVAAGCAILGRVQANEALELFSWLSVALSLCAAAVQSSPRLGVTLVSLFCASANGYLLNLKVAHNTGPSLCSINEVIDCSRLNSSEYSEFYGIPITLFGVAFYLALAVISLSGPKTTPRFHQSVGIFSLIALGYSFFLANVAAGEGVICPFCISIYIGNFLLLWAALRGLRQSGHSLFSDLSSTLKSTSFMGVSVVYLIIAGGSVGLLPQSSAAQIAAAPAVAHTQNPSAVAAQYYAKPEGVVTLDGTEPIYGNPKAPYTIVEFADYGCPHCALAAVALKKLIDHNPNIQLRFRVFPLSGECNPGLQPGGGPERCYAAAAAECAHVQGKFWDLQKLIFVNQRNLDLDSLRFMASQAKLDLDQWTTCMEDPKTMEAVEADANAGVQAEVHGTPTLFLKGTHGDDFVLIPQGPAAILKLVEAHMDGVIMLPPQRSNDQH